MNSPSSPDDEQTVIRTGASTTGGRTAGGPDSDFAPSSTYWATSLPEGLRLGEYEIKNVIGEGGFGIVYLAWDHFLQRQVALKEYMPSSLAARSRTGLEVVVKSERHRETFQAGLRSFVNEARLLAQFDHPALVKVYRFWEANGTAYMVMPYVVGPTLKHALAQLGKPPSEGWLRDSLLHPLLGAIGLLHKAQCLHRDIAPDNILLTETGPLLLDFGAARQIIGDLSKSLTVVLKPGYAPIEQYGEVDSLAQGPWTDVYALAGVVRYAVTGKVPPSATGRLINDTMKPLAEELAGRYSESFLRAVDAALSVRPEQRPQDVWAFQTLLDDGLEPEITTASPTLPVALDDEDGAPSQWPPAGPRTGHRGATTTGRTGWRTTTSPATLGPRTGGTGTTVSPAATQGPTAPSGTWGESAHAAPSPALAPAAALAPPPVPASTQPPSQAAAVVPQPASAAATGHVANTTGTSGHGQPAAVAPASAKAALLGAAATVLVVAMVGGGWWALRAPSSPSPTSAQTPTTDAPDTAANGQSLTAPAVDVAPAPVAASPSPGASTNAAGTALTPPGALVPATTATASSTPAIAGQGGTTAPVLTAPTPQRPQAAMQAPAPAPAVATTRGASLPPATAGANGTPAATGRAAVSPARTAAVQPPPRPTPAAPSATRDAPTASPARVEAGGNRAARCSDILQKASLEPLTPGETAFLRSECK